MGHDLGFATEKVAEVVLLSKGAGAITSGVRNGFFSATKMGAIQSGKIGKYGYIFAKHEAHHSFGRFGRLPLFQLNVWKSGIKGSGRTIFRIPLRN